MVNWQEIHLGFTPELQKEWENRGFSYKQTEWWIDIGLQPKDTELAYYLQKRTYRMRGASWNEDEVDYESIEKWKGEYINHKWLEKEYPLQERTNVKKINIDGKNLKGTLAVGDVDGFVNLEEFRCLNNHLLTEIDISKCTKLKKVICINNTKLVNLHLPNSISFLECQANPLTFLSLRICSKLKEINCSGNLLKSIKLPYLCHELEKLDISNNDFAEQDLNFLSHFGYSKLERLNLGNWNRGMIEKEKIQQGIYNRFYGSLEPLKNLKKLRFLRICNTDIDSGLEHLPNNIETFDCSSYLRSDAKVSEIFNLFANEEGIVDIKFWGSEFEERLKLAKAKSILAQELQEREELTQQLEQTKNVCFQQEQTINYLQQTLTDLQEEKTQVETELLGKINELKYELNLSTKKGIEQENQLSYWKTRATFEQSLGNIRRRLDKEQSEWLGTLLEAQAEVSKNNNQFASRQLVKAKEKLSGTLTKKEMDNICRKQAQLAYIEMQLQEQNLEAKIEIISKN